MAKSPKTLNQCSHPSSKYLTTAALAAELGVSTNSLRLLRFRRQGPEYFKIGSKTVIYAVAAVSDWLHQRAVAPDKWDQSRPVSPSCKEARSV